jgi:hypothetical protein
MDEEIETIDTSTIQWDFERIERWGIGPAGMTARLALTFNTLEILNSQIEQTPNDSPFYFLMKDRLKHKAAISEHGGDELRVSKEAGYFLPVGGGVVYPPFMTFFDGIDKYGRFYDDDSVLVTAFNVVADKTKEMILESSSEIKWKEKRDAFAVFLADELYELADSPE